MKPRSEVSYDALRRHRNHDVACVAYDKGDQMCLVCKDCYEIIVSAIKPKEDFAMS